MQDYLQEQGESTIVSSILDEEMKAKKWDNQKSNSVQRLGQI